MILERYIDKYNFEDNLIELIDCDSYESCGIGLGRVWEKSYFAPFEVKFVNCEEGKIIIAIGWDEEMGE